MQKLFAVNKQKNREALAYLETTWHDGYIPMLIDALYLAENGIDRLGIQWLLEAKTGQQNGQDVFAWMEWLWNREEVILPYHGEWMAQIHKGIDARFATYFRGRTEQSLIRLDEVRWGGVVQDGIPPLRQPEMITAAAADYLADDNVVFGISINGDHRAYPKRILAWHEMFVDEIGGEPIAGVYCTLCGTVIAYNTRFEGKDYDLGTSGFLYRSNKLMYDRETQSLWNTIEGTPVIGPLIDEGIVLNSHSVVTTTWGEWRALHPDTKVLSLDTGHRRDYAEGAAYRKYFATDDLMFHVPTLDDRLPNKAEVLVIRAEGYREDPLAISAEFLRRKRIYQDKIGDTRFVVVTDKSGGNRVYRAGDHSFKKLDKGRLKAEDGVLWTVEEERLVSPGGEVLERLPYHRIFWFAWFNAYPETRLVR